jgi:redox-sensing transcriptional repressor
LANYGLRIVAGFDTNPAIAGTTICGVPIYDMADFAELIAPLNAEIGIIAVPSHVAQQVSDTMVAVGIKALWNFTPFRITAPEGIVITNTSIYAHLAVMYNRLGLQNSLKK